MTNPKGITSRRTRLGVEIVRVHYTADPERGSDWATHERQKYSSQAAWDREQEIVHDAGGGELLFAEILNRYADKIIIRDPDFEVPPTWKRIGGFDHGKTNPTAALVAVVDYDGRVYCLSEYYQPGFTPSQHMDNLRNLPGFLEARRIVADPSIFHATQAQSEGGFKSIEELYREAGLTRLWEGESALLGTDLAKLPRSGGEQWRVPKVIVEFLGGLFLAFANLPVVDDHIVLIGAVVGADGIEGEVFEVHSILLGHAFTRSSWR
jgi:hypothetical protein